MQGGIVVSEKKTNDILEEQRKAREEFLKLKKMQHGEISAPPKPSEVAILPKTPKEKLANFWFQYKWHIIAIFALGVVLAVMITQCATRVKYDLEVIYFTYTPVFDEQTNQIAAYMESLAEDVNKDGEVHVQVINCSYEKTSGNSQYNYSVLTKLQTLLAGDENALLFITQEDSYEYLNQIGDDTLFTGEPYFLGESFYAATRSESLGDLPEGLQISCRRVTETTLAKRKNIQEIYASSLGLLEALQNAEE